MCLKKEKKTKPHTLPFHRDSYCGYENILFNLRLETELRKWELLYN